MTDGGKRGIEVVGGIIRKGEKYLLGKRPLGKSLGGHWEFIGGKIEPGETPEQALARECREEIALDIETEKIRTKEKLTRCIELMQKDAEETPARVPYIGKSANKRRCWRPKRKK
jgi:mutator protein MutT